MVADTANSEREIWKLTNKSLPEKTQSISGQAKSLILHEAKRVYRPRAGHNWKANQRKSVYLKYIVVAYVGREAFPLKINKHVRHYLKLFGLYYWQAPGQQLLNGTGTT